MLATSNPAPPFKGLGEARERLLRPAVGFRDPYDVLKDCTLDAAEKRAVLSSWASDAAAVEGHPELRWPLGLAEPIALDEVLDARAALDRLRS